MSQVSILESVYQRLLTRAAELGTTPEELIEAATHQDRLPDWCCGSGCRHCGAWQEPRTAWCAKCEATTYVGDDGCVACGRDAISSGGFSCGFHTRDQNEESK